MRLETYQHSSDQLTQSYRVLEADFKTQHTELNTLKAQFTDLAKRREGEAKEWEEREVTLSQEKEAIEERVAQLKARNSALERELIIARNSS